MREVAALVAVSAATVLVVFAFKPFIGAIFADVSARKTAPISRSLKSAVEFARILIFKRGARFSAHERFSIELAPFRLKLQLRTALASAL